MTPACFSKGFVPKKPVRVISSHSELSRDLTQFASFAPAMRLSGVEDALAWLERLPGVGRKVAAATLDFSTLRKRALVIDTHHLRVLRRLGFLSGRCTLRRAYDRIMPLVPTDWPPAMLDEHHQLMKCLGQEICRHGMPICRRCPLENLCPMALARIDGDQGGTARRWVHGLAERGRSG